MMWLSRSFVSRRLVTVMAGAVALALTMSAGGILTARPAGKARPAPQVATPPDARAVALRIQGFYDRAPGFHANFTQEVRKRGLKRGITGKGRVWLKKGATRKVPDKGGKGQTTEVDPGKMRWDYPTWEKYYFSDGNILWSYDRRQRLAVKMSVQGSQLYQATRYLIGQGDLARDFDLALVKSTVPNSLVLQLTPKEGTGVMRYLKLVVDRRTYAVKGSVLVDPLGDSTSLYFTNADYGALDDKLFEWQPPKGVTVKSLQTPPPQPAPATAGRSTPPLAAPSKKPRP